MRPRTFLMENVPAIGTRRGRDLLRALTLRTSELGYAVYERTLDALDYGVAQHRRRTFIIGIHPSGSEFRWPSPAPSTGPKTVRAALGDLPSPPADGSRHPDIANYYREARLSPLNLERIKHVPEGGGRLDLPLHLQLACHAEGHRHLDTYGRLAWDKPSGTITARFEIASHARPLRPSAGRSLDYPSRGCQAARLSRYLRLLGKP